MRLFGRQALVTGAGRGIGRAIVARLAAEGATVTALGRNEADLASLADETGCGRLVADLADRDGAARAVAARLPFDLLVNNAGITHLAPALETTEAAMRDVYGINVLAVLRMAQIVAGDLIGRGAPGAIVNVSSVASAIGLADHAAYCASKGALDALTRVLAVEWGPRRIRVNAVNPAVTLTPMGALAWSDPAKSEPMLARIPLRRFVEPDEVARTVAFLLSEDAAMVNGVCLDVDGGLRAG